MWSPYPKVLPLVRGSRSGRSCPYKVELRDVKLTLFLAGTDLLAMPKMRSVWFG